MNRKDVTKLVSYSYTKNKLDGKKVENVANLLSLKELKAYARALELEEQKHRVYIALPSKKLYNANEKLLKTLFKDKEIILKEDPSLILGMRILDNDMLYEVSLSEKIDRLSQGIIDQY